MLKMELLFLTNKHDLVQFLTGSTHNSNIWYPQYVYALALFLLKWQTVKQIAKYSQTQKNVYQWLSSACHNTDIASFYIPDRY